MMKTPICDFVKQYREKNPTRLHMPGHKGQPLLGFEDLDITEFEGADVLYHPQGIIKESQQNAAALFGTAATFYSTEGCSLAIRGMLYLVKAYAKTLGKKPIIAAGRNAHTVFVTAAGLLDLPVKWLFPEASRSVVSCPLTPRELDDFLVGQEEKPVAVYLTSPDYLGNTADIRGLAAVCHRHGVLLLVDNAHGAYLRFLSPSRHPMDLGADVSCDSAHKTLPVLTGGAYLHIARRAPAFFKEQATTALSLFASTSPSYLILQSLDRVNEYLSRGYDQTLGEFIPKVEGLKQRLHRQGYALTGDEPLKITLAPKSYGYTGDELAAVLEKEDLVCEFHDPDFLVMMLTPQNGENALETIGQVLSALPQKPPILWEKPFFSPPKKGLPLQEALFAPAEELPVKDCVGRILSAPTVACPPAVPVVVSGEVIDQTAVQLMEYYGHTTCRVVKKF